MSAHDSTYKASSPSSSQASLLSSTTTSSTFKTSKAAPAGLSPFASESQTTLVNRTRARQPPQKDFDAAFAALATSFGTGGRAPVVVKKRKEGGVSGAARK